MPGRGGGCRPLTSQQGCSRYISPCSTSGAGRAYWTTGTSGMEAEPGKEGEEACPLGTGDNRKGGKVWGREGERSHHSSPVTLRGVSGRGPGASMGQSVWSRGRILGGLVIGPAALRYLGWWTLG